VCVQHRSYGFGDRTMLIKKAITVSVIPCSRFRVWFSATGRRRGLANGKPGKYHDSTVGGEAWSNARTAAF